MPVQKGKYVISTAHFSIRLAEKKLLYEGECTETRECLDRTTYIWFALKEVVAINDDIFTRSTHVAAIIIGVSGDNSGYEGPENCSYLETNEVWKEECNSFRGRG